MCLLGRSKFCLICLLLYTLLPSFTFGTSTEDGNKTSTYSQAKTKSDPGLTEDIEMLQLQETMPELLEMDFYINKLMTEYGNGTGMTFEGFEHLLHNLGLGKIVLLDHSTDCHKPDSNSNFISFHKSHNHSVVSDEPGSTKVHCKDKIDNSEHNHDDHDHSHDNHDNNHDDHKHDHDLEHNHDDHEHKHDDNEHHPDDNELNHDDHEHNHDDHEHNHDNHEHSHDDHEHNHDKHVHDKNSTLPSKSSTNRSDETTTVSAEAPLEMAYGDGDSEDHIHNLNHNHSKQSISQENKCLPARTFLYISKSQEQQYLSRESFLNLCPSLIYQISTDSCHNYHDKNIHFHSNHQKELPVPSGDEQVRGEGRRSTHAKVWGFSTVSVAIISLAGLLGVAVIPFMQKVFYNHMLQFLVALAVGALSGDALLHMIPHAMSGGHGENGDHGETLYKGLLGLFGIFIFFIIERVLTIFTDLKRRKKQKKNKKYGSLEKIGEKLAADCDEMMMSVHPNKALPGYAEEAHSEHCMISFENGTTVSHQHSKLKNLSDSDHNDSPYSDSEEQVDMLMSTNSHGHGHSHCVDGASDSIAAVAWMLILGDGVHNFSDGLAIGAAFSNSITEGFSTSIAIFCHELPHKIGDFAMLLRAGMAPKKAIIYNCLSSILCFVGMSVGVAMGNIENANLWIFAMVGGMFLYIALVDLLPEMSSVVTKKGENPFCHLMFQIVGMSLGAGIMFVIALYEEQLKSVLD